jgi:hypothetical protein
MGSAPTRVSIFCVRLRAEESDREEVEAALQSRGFCPLHPQTHPQFGCVELLNSLQSGL